MNDIEREINSFDFYISGDGYLVNYKYDIKYLIDFSESNIPSMPEANETSVKVAGRDGDIPLKTVYEPIPFLIVCYTEDNLTFKEKIQEENKMNRFLDSIKNNTIDLSFEKEEKFYNVKYSGNLTTIRYPKHLKFSIPLKSSDSYAKSIYKSKVIGDLSPVEFESDTIKEVGPVFIIEGPATNPRIALNNYQMYYDSSLAAGEKLIIDCSKSTVTLIDTNGYKFNAMGYYNHEFPKIKNGINTLEVKAGISNGNQLKTSWYDLKF